MNKQEILLWVIVVLVGIIFLGAIFTRKENGTYHFAMPKFSLKDNKKQKSQDGKSV